MPDVSLEERQRIYRDLGQKKEELEKCKNEKKTYNALADLLNQKTNEVRNLTGLGSIKTLNNHSIQFLFRFVLVCS
jgi:hypothetical protein